MRPTRCIAGLLCLLPMGGAMLVPSVASAAHASSRGSVKTPELARNGSSHLPAADSYPELSGSTVAGGAVTTSSGKWANKPTAFAFRWRLCNDQGSACKLIPGASGQTFRLSSIDVGHKIEAAVTAINGAGSASATSQPSARVAVKGRGPTNTSPPVISGSPAAGHTLTVSNGSWTDRPTAYAYAWIACQPGGTGCQQIPGATTNSYTVSASNAGKALKADVTATDHGGSTLATSAATLTVSAPVLPPVSSAPPVLSGSAIEGQTLSVGTGSWQNGPTSYSYAWQDCAAATMLCVAISGANSSTYALQATDVGSTVEAVVTAANSAGSASVATAATSIVVATPPTNMATPAVSGTPQQGDALRVSNGTWSGNPTSYSYAWRDCNSSGASCSTISGASSASYTLQSSNVGSTVEAVVTATNNGGSSSAASTTTPPVAAAPSAPANTTAPVITGTPQQGDVLAASNGTWSGSPTSYTYSWEDCDTSGSNCSTISGANTSNYTLTGSDVGTTLKVVVTAANATGSSSASSTQTSTVLVAAPVNSAAPSISGTAQQGDTLSVSNGTWSGSPTSYAYSWEDCNSGGTGCAAISGASASTYTVQASDVGDTIVASVTATNAGGSHAASSSPSAVVTGTLPAAPTNTTAPQITGTADEGDTLTVSNGGWTNSPTSYSYEWQDCNSSGASCTTISGATSSSYTVGSGDANSTIVARVTATNAGGSASASSAATATVPAAGLDGIKVSGSELVNDAGQQIHLHGVDEEGTEYACSQGWGIFDTSNSAQNAADMASWHINFVRIGLNALCVDCALGVPTAYCGSNYMNAVEAWVDELNSDGIYVEVMLMWDFPGTSDPAGISSSDSYQLAGGPTEDHAPQAWQTMATDFKNNPNVMLGVWGEDYDSYTCKLSGGSSCGQVQASVETTSLTASASSGSTTSIQVSKLAYPLVTGESIWLGANGSGSGAADTLTVTSNVAASSGTVTIPVSGTLSTTYASGATVYYGNIDPGDHVGETPWLSGSNPVIDINYTTAGAQQAVNVMRGAGFSGPIVYTCADAANVCANPSGGGSYSGGTWLTDHPTDPDNSIVAAADLYGPSASYGAQVCSGTSCFNTAIKPIIQAGYPFIINEAGESTDGSDCTSSYMSTMLPWMDANGASGYATWIWNGDDPTTDCLDLVTGNSSATPNTNGNFATWVRNYYTTTFPVNQ